jgi:hypothetical protein
MDKESSKRISSSTNWQARTVNEKKCIDQAEAESGKQKLCQW